MDERQENIRMIERRFTLFSFCHGALVPWCLGAMVPRCLGATVPRCLGAMALYCLGAMVPRCYGATVPWCLGATVPSCLGAIVPVCHGAMVRRQRLVVRQGPGTMGLGPGPPLRTLLQNTIRTMEPPDSKAGLFPVRSPLLSRDIRCRESFSFREEAQVPTYAADGARREGYRFKYSLALSAPGSLLNTFVGSFCCAGFDNDPSAGSPTETLLRLLLSLNDKVQWTSHDVAGSEPPTLPRSEHFTGSFNR
ncbi:hypothetical protein CQW23_31685 [Capsicum baccatum]|uniref:Uncharacterized protein n=1 Tax=Capsicum baccatum TaxID=33114 RepID=A0A2G2V6U7_CAPBA|nr:hypothetical protein CQW23_31685 [Capsicum baccatum]